MNKPSLQIPTDLKQLKKQISALKYQLQHDTNEKDREIHKQALEDLRATEKVLERRERDMWIKTNPPPVPPVQNVEKKTITKQYGDQLKKGTAIEIKISLEVDNFNALDFEEMLSQIANNSHDFYLHAAKKIKNMLL